MPLWGSMNFKASLPVSILAPPLTAMWPGAIYLTPLFLSCLNYKLEIIIVPISQSCCYWDRDGGDSISVVLGSSLQASHYRLLPPSPSESILLHAFHSCTSFLLSLTSHIFSLIPLPSLLEPSTLSFSIEHLCPRPPHLSYPPHLFPPVEDIGI